MKATATAYRWGILVAAVVVSTLAGPVSDAAETRVQGRIMQEAQEGVYVDAGADRGLRPGAAGTLQLDDGRIFAFEVVSAERQSALLRLPAYRGQERLSGRMVEIVISEEPLSQTEKRPPQPNDPNGVAKSSTNAPMPDGQEPFVPLLAPVPRGPEPSKPPSTSHGRIQVHQMFQTDSKGDLGHAVTRLSSSGGVDRINGSPWSFEWSGDVRYRTGDAYLSNPNYQEPHLDLYRAMFQSPFGEDGLLRFGRFVPYELPAIGYLDGLQGQVQPGEHTRLGVVGGLKPDRIDLDASANEPLVVHDSCTSGYKRLSLIRASFVRNCQWTPR
ncbi:MAG: hypothetical protein M1376_09880 [Planctomycetes bacterium]|nr:hypothetical protein [Planctomycetota bacterium]